MTNSELIALSLRDAAAALADGRATSAALCGAFLERIQAVEPKVKALLGVNPESVMAQALASESRRAAGALLVLRADVVLERDRDAVEIA